MIGSLLQVEFRDGMCVLGVPALDVPDARMLDDLGLYRRDQPGGKGTRLGGRTGIWARIQADRVDDLDSGSRPEGVRAHVRSHGRQVRGARLRYPPLGPLGANPFAVLRMGDNATRSASVPSIEEEFRMG